MLNNMETNGDENSEGLLGRATEEEPSPTDIVNSSDPPKRNSTGPKIPAVNVFSLNLAGVTGQHEEAIIQNAAEENERSQHTDEDREDGSRWVVSRRTNGPGTDMADL